MITLLAYIMQDAVTDPARRSAQLKSIGISVAVAVFIIAVLIGKKK